MAIYPCNYGRDRQTDRQRQKYRSKKAIQEKFGNVMQEEVLSLGSATKQRQMKNMNKLSAQ
jgi:hypothetical protein